MLAATCILTGLLACRDIPASTSPISISFVPCQAIAVPEIECPANFATGHPEICIHRLPMNAVVIIGSLDLCSGLHQVVVDARPSGAEEFADLSAGPRVAICDFRQPVLLLNRDDQLHQHQPPFRKNLRSLDTDTQADQITCCDSPVNSAMHFVCAVDDQPQLARLRRFLVPHFTDQGTHHIIREAICVRQQQNIMVYCCRDLWSQKDADQQEQLKQQATAICCELSGFTRPQIELLLGPVCDVDHNNHLTVLMTELDQRRHSRDAPVQGCVRESDLLDDQQPFGGDIIYLDHNVPDGLDLRALLVHETAHLAVYSAGLRHQMSSHPAASDDFAQKMPSWLNEAIAHTAERILAPDTANFARRMKQLSASSALCPVVMPAEGSSMASRRGGARAAATLFVESMLRQPADLNRLLHLDEPPITRLAQLGDQSFDQAFRNWSRYSLRQLSNRQRQSLSSLIADAGNSSPLLPLRNEMTQCNHLRGTAAQYFIATEPVHCLRIQSTAEAELQVTVLLPD